MNALYESVREWTSRADPGARFEEGELTLSEPWLGEYAAPTLSLLVSGGKPLNLVPIGCDVVGGEGWVDMHTLFGTQTFMYHSEDNARYNVALNGAPPSTGVGWVWVEAGTTSGYPLLTVEVFTKLIKRLGW